MSTHIHRVRQDSSLPHVPYVDSEFIQSQEQVSENGRVFVRHVSKQIKPSERFKGLSMNDFALENVIAAGAIDTLRDCKIIGLDGKSVSSIIEANETALAAALAHTSETAN